MKHILIIDDDVSIGDMLTEVLTREGYRTTRAYSGTEALLVLSSAKPDLVLLDLMLPGLNGEEVLPQISGIPVIILSAKVDVENKVELLLGAPPTTSPSPLTPGSCWPESQCSFEIPPQPAPPQFSHLTTLPLMTNPIPSPYVDNRYI